MLRGMSHINTAHLVGGLKGIFNFEGESLYLGATHIGLLACRCWQMEMVSVTELLNFTRLGADGGGIPIFGWMS